MQDKKVVYTCITGGYDNVIEHKFVNNEWDYILFSDNEELIKKGQIHHWKVRRTIFNELDSVRNARFHKINAFRVLSEYKYSLYVDGNICINDSSVFEKVENMIQENITVSIPLHQTRDCIYVEAEIIKERHIDYDDVINNQCAFLRDEGYPSNNNLFETCIMFREHNDEHLVLAQKLWWEMIKTFSKRDQMSQQYAFWKHNISVYPLYQARGEHRKSESLTFIKSSTHNQDRIIPKLIYPKWFITTVCLCIPFSKIRRKIRNDMKNARATNTISPNKKNQNSAKETKNTSDLYTSSLEQIKTNTTSISKKDTHTKLSLIIPVYNAPEDVKKCLDSIVKNFNREHEFIIVDDCSEKETEELLQNFAKEHSFVTLYRNPENLGFVKTCNFAMKKAQNGIIVLLNSDTIIPSMFCEKIVECFEKKPNIGIACPIPSNSGQFSFELPDNMDIEQMNERICKKHKIQYPLLSSCNGFCFCIRKVVTEVIGHFDEVYGQGYNEEVDFCYKAISNGYQCALIDNLYVIHKRHASFGSKQRDELIQKNNIVFNERWADFAKKWEAKHYYSNPVEKIKQEIFPEPFKILKKTKSSIGRRSIYFCGIKIFSYKRKQTLQQCLNDHQAQTNAQLKKLARAFDLQQKFFITYQSKRKTTDFIAQYQTKFAPFGYTVGYREGKYYVQNDILTIQGPAPNTFWTCLDVLCKDDYNFSQKDDYILFDIGFYIGSTSIFKAQDKQCLQIYAFEPFQETLNAGLENIKNNPNTQKITAFNFGLGRNDTMVEVHYNEERPGAMSTVKDVFAEGKTTEIQVKQASAVLATLFAKHSEKIVLKIDCEGAEFDILEDLNANKLLQRVSIVVMEWHFQSPQPLIDILVENGFCVFTEKHSYNKLGFIRAVKA